MLDQSVDPETDVPNNFPARIFLSLGAEEYVTVRTIWSFKSVHVNGNIELLDVNAIEKNACSLGMGQDYCDAGESKMPPLKSRRSPTLFAGSRSAPKLAVGSM